jgi:membrane-associated phospholipid phosphatase
MKFHFAPNASAAKPTRVKVKPFPAPRLLISTMAQARTILRDCWGLFRRTKVAALAAFAGAILLALLIWPHDQAWLNALHEWQGYDHAAAHNFAWYLSTFGDYPTYNLPLALLIWLYGAVTKSSTWRRIAIVAFLGASFAGLFDDFFRLTLGRPRPDMLSHSDLSDRFYGPLFALKGGFQSFPSGHAASTFGTAVALLLTEWRLGILTTIIACSVVWARMELYRHYPSDVVVGAIIGIYFGLLVGYGVKVHELKVTS